MSEIYAKEDVLKVARDVFERKPGVKYDFENRMHTFESIIRMYALPSYDGPNDNKEAFNAEDYVMELSPEEELRSLELQRVEVKNMLDGIDKEITFVKNKIQNRENARLIGNMIEELKQQGLNTSMINCILSSAIKK